MNSFKKMLSVAALLLAMVCMIPIHSEAASRDVIIIDQQEKGSCIQLIVYPTSFDYDFIVIWEDPEGLDILSYPWTGVNGGRHSEVVYRKQYKDHILVNGVVRNNRGNIFFRLVDGNYVYSGDVAFDFEANAALLNNYHACHMGEFYTTFYNMCEEGGVMDVKLLSPRNGQVVPYNAYFKTDECLKKESAEALGNMMYGYVGLDIGIHESVLKSADIFANVLKQGFDFEKYLYSYNDDPEDADWIDEGMAYYYHTH